MKEPPMTVVAWLQRENNELRSENDALRLRSVVDAEALVLVLDIVAAMPWDDQAWTDIQRRAEVISIKYRQAVTV